MSLECIGGIESQVKIGDYIIQLSKIEAVLNSHPGVEQSLVLARDKDSEKQLAAYVVARANGTTAADIRFYTQAKLPDYMVPSFFVMLEAFPVDSSGKILVDELPAPFEIAPPEAAYVPPGTDLQSLIAGLWREVLGVNRVGIQDDYFELGGDSIQSIRIAVRANDAGVKFDPRQILQFRTIARLASAIEVEAPSIQNEAQEDAGEGPLTPIQHWFFENSFEAMHHWNQARTLRAAPGTDHLAIEPALEQLVLHHSALRHRFIQDELGWRRTGPAEGQGQILISVDMSGISKSEWEHKLDDLMTAVQATLDIERGDLVRAVLLDFGGGAPSSLILIIHHLSVDAVSWGIILEDLETLYRDIRNGREQKGGKKTTSFNRWADRLHEYAQSPDVRAEFPYWLSNGRKWTSKLPVDYSEGVNSEGSVDTVLATLTREETKALLQEVPRVYNTTINEAMLTALALSAYRWTGSRTLLVDLENPGREELFQGVDLSRTVGWFTSVCPLLIDLGPFSDIEEALIAVKEKVRGIPKGGIGFGLLRYLCEDAVVSRKLAALPRAELRFNYLGQPAKVSRDDSIFQRYYGASGRTQDPRAIRSYLVDVTGAITNGQLYTAWIYSRNRHRGDTIEKLANGFIDSLRKIITRAQESDERGDAHANFFLPDLSRRDVKKLLTTLGDDE